MVLVFEVLKWSGVFVWSLLFSYGLHCWWSFFYHLQSPPQDIDDPEPPGEYPRLLVQLPLYNERTSVGGLLGNLSHLQWPRDRLRIQILDDSTDETTELIQQELRKLSDSDRFTHVRRSERTGFKAGALEFGRSLAADADLVLILDADFRPSPDLAQNLYHRLLTRNDAVAVQARWGYRNRDQNWLTHLQALAMDTHFFVEQWVRDRQGFMVAFNGTAGLFLRKALDRVGGFHARTLTEDLELSCRLRLAGNTIAYAPDIVCPQELPASLSAFVSQQERWATGTLQTARLWLRELIFCEQLSWSSKLHIPFHLLHYCIHPLLIGMLLLPFPGFENPYLSLVLVLVISLGPLSLYYRSQSLVGGSYLRLWRLPGLLFLGGFLMLPLTLALMRGLTTLGGEFVRTAKSGEKDSTDFQCIFLIQVFVGILGALLVLQNWEYSYGVFSISIAFGSVFGGFIRMKEAIISSRRSHNAAIE